MSSAWARWGVPRAELLRAAGLTEKDLHDPDARVPLSAIVRLWRATTVRVPDPLLGLRLGAGTRARELGLVGYTLVYSSTLAAALRRLARYDRIVSDALTVHLDVSRDATWVRVDVQPKLRAFRAAADARLAALVSVCREIVAPAIAPLVVQFPYRRPRDVREYERFFRAPLEFSAPATAFMIGRQDLSRPVVLSDETLCGYLDGLAQGVLTELHADSTVRARVHRVLWSQMSEGHPDIHHVARALGMTPRTLQRRLRLETTTFLSVVEQFRRDMAPGLLREGQLTVSEVAFLLGYEDPRSFQRAFRGWFGHSPTAFRRASD
jgi:AraC-like DNA-binding protein